ncbi:hypothetical protein FEM21_25920 [Flavobacterium seoulense]|uniref:Uncharacterized protein n=1 Tax=Flavobacterium seoulense TaxID=1492738 RepID=A0A066WKL3_9FLAO|nr:hypothetical protein FEM21_25920 [Flavobacterium seoulense]
MAKALFIINSIIWLKPDAIESRLKLPGSRLQQGSTSFLKLKP